MTLDEKIKLYKLHSQYNKHELNNGVCACGYSPTYFDSSNRCEEILSKLASISEEITLFMLFAFNYKKDIFIKKFGNLINWDKIKETDANLIKYYGYKYVLHLARINNWAEAKRFLMYYPEPIELILKSYLKSNPKMKKIIKELKNK